VRLPFSEDQEPVLRDRRVERGAAFLPIREQLGDRYRIDDAPEMNVRSDLGAFLQHADADFTTGRAARAASAGSRRRGQTARPTMTNIELHRVALHVANLLAPAANSLRKPNCTLPMLL